MDELRTKASALEKELRTLLDAAKGRDTPGLTDDEQTKYDETRTALEAIDKLIAEEDRLTDAESVRVKLAEERARLAKESATPAKKPETPASGTPPDDDGLEIRGVRDREAEKPFAHLGENLLAIRNACAEGSTPSKRLLHMRAEERAITGMSESVPSDGGFAIEKDFSDDILTRVFTGGQILQRIETTPLGPRSNGLKKNVIDETSRADGSRSGGVRAYWVDEAGALTGEKPKMRQITLTLNKLIGAYYTTEEELEDGAALSSMAAREFANEIIFKTEDALFNGDGSGKPLGITVGKSLISITKETNQTLKTIVYENVLKMWSRAAGRSNAAWFVNQDTEPQLNAMSLAIGTGGVPVYLPAGGISGLGFSTLFGRPVVPVEYCATLGTVGDIVLADWSDYIFIDKGGVKSASSMHVRFLFGEEVFRITYRLDGQPINNSALTPFKGTTTTSHYVALATRA